MTIPRIGDKIVRIRNQHPTESMEQIIPNQDFENTESEPQEQISQEIEDNAQTEEQQVSQNNEVTSQNQNIADTNEYSIEHFTKDYLDKLHSEVLPLLAQYEPERKQRFVLAILCGGLCWLAALLDFLFVDADRNGDIFWGLIALGGFIWYTIKKQFEKKIKKKVMPILMKAVPDFYWQSETPIPAEDITESQIFPLDKQAVKKFDDCFSGKYRDVDIQIAECSYKANKTNVFSGAVIRIEMNKNFEGLTVIRPKKNVDFHNIKDLKQAKLHKVELEDVEFNKNYDIYSTDQIEARYLLTTSFMERFKNITLAFDSKASYCSFQGKYVYIAPFCKKDLFSVCSLRKNVADEVQFVKLFNEFTSILELVDHFKLDKKLGL